MAKYSLGYVDGVRVDSDQIMRAYAEMGMASPKGLMEITLHGIRYSYQDYDVLAAAMSELERKRGIGAHKWVATL